jgi:hypothetical protein
VTRPFWQNAANPFVSSPTGVDRRARRRTSTRREFPPREWRSGKKSTARAPKAGGTSPGWARQARRNHGRGQGRRRGHRDAAARFARALLVCAARSTRAAGGGVPGDVAPAGSRWSRRARSGSGARRMVCPSCCTRAGRIPPADRGPRPSDAPKDGVTARPTGQTRTGLTARPPQGACAKFSSQSPAT